MSEKVEKWTTKLLRWIENEDFAERLATKLTNDDLQKLMEEFSVAVNDKVIRWCQFVMTKPLQRERLEMVEEMASRSQMSES